MNPKDSETMALVWIEMLDGQRIPYQHYETLYKRSVELRARRMSQGLKCDDFSVEMMIACWPSLAKEIHDKRVAEGKYLSSTAESDCDRCYGSGIEVTERGAKNCSNCLV